MKNNQAKKDNTSKTYCVHCSLGALGQRLGSQVFALPRPQLQDFAKRPPQESFALQVFVGYRHAAGGGPDLVQQWW